MTPSQRIVLNTAATYLRSLVGMAIGLFSIRWVLSALGQSDYGLYCIVGALMPFITFFNGILGVSVARHYAYSIGQADRDGLSGVNDDLMRWFNTALSIHLAVPFVLLLVGAPLGEYAIRNWIVVPPERIVACVWVFRIVLVTTFLNMLSVPFLAMYTARQLISVLAAFGILASFLNFCFAAMLSHVTGDKLIAYALFMLVLNAGLPVCQMFLALRQFPECRVKLAYWKDRKRLSAVTSFAGWTFFGGSGGLLASYGTAFVTNRYFGPVLNSSYGIANQVSSQAGTLATALTGALSPAVTTREGSGDRSGTLSLATSTGKMGALLMLFFAIPLVLELPTVLDIWLEDVPPHAVPICMFALIAGVLDKVTLGHQMAISAVGRIARWQIAGGSILACTIPASVLLVVCGMGPISASIAILAASCGCLVSNIYFARRLLGMSVSSWLRSVFVPLLLTICASIAMGMFPRFFFSASFVRVCVTACCTMTAFLPMSWFVVFSDSERRVFADNVSLLLKRLRG